MAAVSGTVHEIAGVIQPARRRDGSARILAILSILLIAIAVVSLGIGSYRLTLHDWSSVLAAPAQSGTARIVLF